MNTPFWQNFRSSCPEVFLEKGVLKICSKFSEHIFLRIPLGDCFWNLKNSSFLIYIRISIINKQSGGLICKKWSYAKQIWFQNCRYDQFKVIMMRLTKKYTFFGSRLRLINFVCMLASVLLHFHKIYLVLTCLLYLRMIH